MEKTELNTPFTNTPWNDDQEIYDFASQKRYQMGHSWEEVHTFLAAEGLDPDYADAIIANMKEQEAITIQDRKKRKWISAGLSIAWAIIAVLIFRPFSYMVSVEYGRYIFIGIMAVGLALINRYRKGETQD